MKFTPIKKDFDTLINTFSDNPLRSKWQIEHYTQPKGRGKIVSHDMLGNKASEDSKKSLLMLSEVDGYGQGMTVGSKGCKVARNYWVENDGHAFPDRETLVRTGYFFHLSIFSTFLLVLKGEFEQYLAKSRRFTIWSPMRLKPFWSKRNSKDSVPWVTVIYPYYQKRHLYLLPGKCLFTICM